MTKQEFLWICRAWQELYVDATLGIERNSRRLVLVASRGEVIVCHRTIYEPRWSVADDPAVTVVNVIAMRLLARQPQFERWLAAFHAAQLVPELPLCYQIKPLVWGGPVSHTDIVAHADGVFGTTISVRNDRGSNYYYWGLYYRGVGMPFVGAGAVYHSLAAATCAAEACYRTQLLEGFTLRLPADSVRPPAVEMRVKPRHRELDLR